VLNVSAAEIKSLDTALDAFKIIQDFPISYATLNRPTQLESIDVK